MDPFAVEQFIYTPITEAWTGFDRQEIVLIRMKPFDYSQPRTSIEIGIRADYNRHPSSGFGLFSFRRCWDAKDTSRQHARGPTTNHSKSKLHEVALPFWNKACTAEHPLSSGFGAPTKNTHIQTHTLSL